MAQRVARHKSAAKGDGPLLAPLPRYSVMIIATNHIKVQVFGEHIGRCH